MATLLGASASSSAPLRRIEEVQFGILGPDEIKAMSVLKVEYPDTMDETKTRVKIGGLLDPRLGTIDRSQKCQTCGEGMSECPGHFGHIELARPVFHIGFLDKVKKILECVCFNCGKLKVDERDPKFVDAMRYRDPKSRLAAMWNIAKTKMICEASAAKEEDSYGPKDALDFSHGGCGNNQPTIRKEGLKLYGSWKKNSKDLEDTTPEKKLITPAEVLNVFRHIPSEDLVKMGLSEQYAKPEWMIITVLPVPPPPVRPSINNEGKGRGEDDLTYKLAEIIKANSNVRRCEQEGAPAHIIQEFEALLQFHVATYMDNDIAGQPQALQKKTGRPVKSIRARLKGKEGRLRGNLMGKRVDFSARTVITGDPNLSLDAVGVPRSIAKTLTYPETVTPYNIHKLQELVRNGPNEHPGAKYVIRDTGERIDLRYHKRGGDINLQFGWRVERHIIDGDVVIFNRQPSLHKMSMMGHKVKVMPYSTFRLNLSCTSPYNADFDGDEMNLHVPQSEETRAEIQEICMVPRQIVSPQSNKPVMGIVQDTLAAVRKLTKRDNFMTKEAVMNILLWVPDWDGTMPPPAIIKPKPMWTGKQILSMVIPKGINLVRDDGAHNPIPADDTGMMIEHGEIIYGIVDKKTVGASAGGLVHVIMREKGPEVTCNWFNGIQRVVNYWLLQNGFSIGIGDTIADRDTMSFITTSISAAKNRVQEIIVEAQQNKLEQEPGMSLRETFEHRVGQVLNKARDDVGKSAQQSMKEMNNLKQMVAAGSKGSFINISQMSACVGQQMVEGKRIPFGFKYRTLPHFTKDDYSPESRGFVENSYLRGLTPQEFFFHAMAGREGLIDTAVKTAETGYIQRRLVKALEDVMIKYDGTVRNSLGDIVQFAYGEDGLDGTAVENQYVDTIPMSHDDFHRRYRIDVMDPKYSIKPHLLEAGNQIAGNMEIQSTLDEEFEQLEADRDLMRNFIFQDGDGFRPLPVQLNRVIKNAQQIFNIDRRRPTDLSPIEIVKGVRDLCKKVIVIRGGDRISHEAQENATLLFQCQLRQKLASRRVIEEYHLNREAFEWIIGEVESQFAQSVAAPGEMVGTLAAQSIGEPATQMTLNTFHYAGVSSKNVTLGVPRLKEILNVARNIKTPSLTIYLAPHVLQNIGLAKEVQSAVEHTTLRTVTKATEIYYDPDPRDTIIEEDRDFVQAFFAIPDEEVEQNLDRQSPWLLRLELDRAKMLDKKLTMADVAGKIAETFSTDMFTIWSEDNADKLIIRCRIIRDEKQTQDEEVIAEEDVFLRNLENHMLDSISLRGLRGITRVFMMEGRRTYEEENGSYGIRNEWQLETDGINLAEALTVKDVDPVRTYSNSFVEVLQVLGIEATRAALLKELRAVIEFDGSKVNYRHMALLADVMTSRGHLMAITRHGINRADTGALMRASFEETVEILMDAAAAGETDDCRGVSENIMLGQLAHLGTGEFDCLLDEKMLSQISVDNFPMGMAMGSTTPGRLGGNMTPYDDREPMYDDGWMSPDANAAFSPLATTTDDRGRDRGGLTPLPGYGGQSPGWAPRSPFAPSSPFNPGTSPGFSPASPHFPTSPQWGGVSSPAFSPSSPSYSPSSPAFSPNSPAAYGQSGAFGAKSPVASYSPQSPSWSPTSPNYSPQSPVYNPSSSYATSPQYSPSSPKMSPTSPAYSPTSPKMSPTSPAYSPTSPGYSPSSPNYSGFGAGNTSPAYSPTSPRAQYSPSS